MVTSNICVRFPSLLIVSAAWKIRSGGRRLGATAAAVVVDAALGLLEERREDAGERDHQRDEEEHPAPGSPQRRVAGRARLLRDVGIGNAAGEIGRASCRERV